MIDARNPYILLGIPYGSSRELALVAFAKRSRSVRRLGREGKNAMTDLTWALNQVSESIRSPDESIGIYRIPADPEAYAFVGAGVLKPRPERLARRYGDLEVAEQALQRRAGQEYLRYLVLLNADADTIPEP